MTNEFQFTNEEIQPQRDYRNCTMSYRQWLTSQRFQGQLFMTPELMGFSMWLLLKCFEAPQANTLQS